LKYVPGNLLYTADTLSRGPVQSLIPDDEPGQVLEINEVKLVVQALSLNPVDNCEDEVMEEEIEAHKEGLLGVLPVTDRKKELIQTETKKDRVLQTLQRTISEGWPEFKQDCPEEIDAYWNYRDEMSNSNGLILKGCRIVVPTVLRKEMLEKIHVGHLGKEKCKRRARMTIFWPGINRDIEDLIEQCEICIQFQPSQAAEPLQPHPVPTQPWEKIGIDLCKSGTKNYVVMVDYFSNFPEVYEVNQQTSSAVIKVMKECFARAGIPYEVFSDNGPCFDSEEFRNFAKLWDFRHSTSSPHFPQSNGLAEGGVKVVKATFEKCLKGKDDPYLGLLSYRGTPLEHGLSPAQIMYGRKIRTNLPMVHQLSKRSRDIAMRKVEQKVKQKDRHDSKGVKPLDLLTPGQTVRIQRDNGRWSNRAVVVKEIAPRSYIVKTENGSLLRRNRRDLLKTSEHPMPVSGLLHDDAMDQITNAMSSAPIAAEATDMDGTSASLPATTLSPQESNQCTSPSEATIGEHRPKRQIRKPQRLIENY
jgi:hypothetical protein